MATNVLDPSDDTRVIDLTKRVDKTSAEVKPRTDKYIWGIYFMLAIISIVELYSASSRDVKGGHIFMPLLRQIALLGGGCVIMIGLQRVKYQMFYKFTWVIVFVSLAAAIWTLFKGQNLNSAVRSFSLGLFSVQTSELIKFSAALLIAKVLGDSQIKVNGKPAIKNSGLYIVTGIVLIFGALIIKQGLTNTLLLACISMTMMIVGGISLRQFFIVFAFYAILGGGYFLYSSVLRPAMKEKTENVQQKPGSDKTVTQVESKKEKTGDRGDVRRSRLLAFFFSDKYKDEITEGNSQEQYSYIAQANGGVFGVGVGNSRETARLPLAFSDYVFAIIVEDIGLIGGIGVIFVYMLLLLRAGAVGARLKKAFPTLLIIGMAVFIVYQALFHMAIVTGVFPVSGQPLPFISKGGSSVIVSSVALGIMLSISRNAARRKDKTASITDETTFMDNPD